MTGSSQADDATRPAPAPSYLDEASSAPLHPTARDVFWAALDRGYGDPRRLHRQGRDARLLLDNARAVVAECLGTRADEIHFTASGTDAVHRGLLGLVIARRDRDVVVHTAVEHSSVLHAAGWREVSGVSVAVDSFGRVDPADVRGAAAAPWVAAVAVQAANQEIGTLQPVDELDLPADVPLLVDAAAAVGHVQLPQRWDVLTASAHKWGGPAGVGVLAIRGGTRWLNPFPGDHAPEGDGFPNVPAALAAAAALQSALAERDEVAARQRRLVDQIRAVASALPDTEVVGHPTERLPHLVTFSCLYLAGDELVTALDRRGFGVASGSACTASTLEPSHVLAAIGALTHGNVRVSLTRDTTEAQVDAFCHALRETVTDLRRGLS